jgi:glycosyltransferase involved in cell wall biosynthesis
MKRRCDEVATFPATTEPKSWKVGARRWVRDRVPGWVMKRPERSLDDVLRRCRADCFLSLAWFDNSPVQVPRVGWILDFQYKHLPELFGPGQGEHIEGNFRREAERANLLMVNCSQEAEDMRQLCPEHAAKVRVVQWVADVPASVYSSDTQEAVDRYHLPQKFLYMPNQFWKHKNHTTVFAALRILRDRGIRPTIVCTGDLHDGRFPFHFDEVLQKLSEWDLRDQVVILGFVPRADVYSLMRRSVGLLNASLFEGLGLSAAEGHSLGKRMLLSDLAAFREHAGPGCVFFDPGNAEDVADGITYAWNEWGPGPDLAMEQVARETLPGRLHEFGWRLKTLFEEVVACRV